MKLLLDEMWSPAVAEQLRERGHDVIAVADQRELRGQSDQTLFALAQSEARAIFTENVRDFRPIAAFELARGRSHSGLIFTSGRHYSRNDRQVIGRVVNALADLLGSGVDLTDLEYWLDELATPARSGIRFAICHRLCELLSDFG